MILIYQFEKRTDLEQKLIFEFYLKNIKFINNWDLVDLSAHKIIGNYAFHYKEKLEEIYFLANSKDLWQERISVIASFYFIKQNDFKLTLFLANKFLNHKHDLMQKAVGWMLREVGKKEVFILEDFLNKNVTKMPRTMLRYSIEKFSEDKRKKFLSFK